MSSSAGLDGAGALLKRAVELDQKQEYAACLMCYQEGVGLLMDVLKECRDSTKREQLRSKLTQYMDRAEKVKEIVEKQREEGKYHEEIHIEENTTGHSYERMFSRFIDETVYKVEIEDPYIRSTHQIFNLLRFCELLVKKATRLKSISVTTGADQDPNPSQLQLNGFKDLETSLKKYKVDFTVSYSSSLHDREIRFDCGWIFKLGRGLDYFKRVQGQFSIGFCDFDLRHCHETKIDIFHKKHTKSSFSGS